MMAQLPTLFYAFSVILTIFTGMSSIFTLFSVIDSTALGPLTKKILFKIILCVSLLLATALFWWLAWVIDITYQVT